MAWYTWIEQRRRLLIGGMALICFSALLVCARRIFIGFDPYWHLQMGKDWVENGLSPWIDHYSFTFPGADIHTPPVLFQAMLYWFVEQFGQEYGFELLRVACFTLTLGLVLGYLKQVRAPVLVYLIALPLTASLIELRAVVRPELLSYSLTVVALMLYRRANLEMSAKAMVPIALLMWFWSNYHSPIIGYVIFFGFFIDVAVRCFNERAPFNKWLHWLAWGLVVLAVGLLRPGLTHPVYDALVFDYEWRTLIQEYQSPLIYKGVAAIYAFMAVTLLTIITSFRQRRFGYLVILAVLLYAVSTVARLVTPAGIAIVCLFAHVVSEIDWQTHLEAMTRLRQRATGLIVLLLVLLSLSSTVKRPYELFAENIRNDAEYPSDIVAYMKQKDLSGNIFNEYQTGGYLIHELSPHGKVYIDGRTQILYPVAHYKRLLSAQVSPEVLREDAQKYGISLAILANKPWNYYVMHEVGGFGLDFVEAGYSLWVRKDPNFPVLGMLLARPACWSEALVRDLNAENRKATELLPGDSALWPFLDLVIGYSNAPDKAAYLGQIESQGNWDDSSWRFAGYSALTHGFDEFAVALFNEVKVRVVKDFLGAAQATMQTGNLDKAESILRDASERNWPNLELADVVIMHGLLQELAEARPVTMISDNYFEYLDIHIQDAGLAGKTIEVTPELYCAREGWEQQL